MKNKKKEIEKQKNTSKDEELSIEVFNKNLMTLINTKPVRDKEKDK